MCDECIIVVIVVGSNSKLEKKVDVCMIFGIYRQREKKKETMLQEKKKKEWVE